LRGKETPTAKRNVMSHTKPFTSVEKIRGKEFGEVIGEEQQGRGKGEISMESTASLIESARRGARSEEERKGRCKKKKKKGKTSSS